MNKRGFLITFLLIVFLLDLSSAQYFDIRYQVRDVIDTAVDVFEPVLQVIFGGYDYTGFLLFEKLLFFIIITSIVYVALDRVSVFNSQPTIVKLISGIIGILSVRFLTVELTETLIFQYKWLGFILIGLLPFAVFFMFLENFGKGSGLFKRLGWASFALVYYGLWNTNNYVDYSNVYFWVMIAAIVMVFAEGIFGKLFQASKAKEESRLGAIAEIGRIEEEIRRVREGHGGLSQSEADEFIRRREKDARKLRSRYL